MLALIQTAVLAHFHLLLCLILPGLAMRHMLKSRFPVRLGAGTLVIEAFALGALWSTAQFFTLYNLASHMPVPATLAVKYLSDFAVIFIGATRGPGGIRALGMDLAGITRVLLRPVNLVGIVIATLFGLMAMIQFPYGLDNAALYWMAVATSDFHVTWQEAQGSPAYISWLFWPNVLTWPNLSAATFGVSIKVVLNILCFFVLKRLCFVWPVTSRAWIALLMYFLVAASFLGVYGLLKTSKETVFGVLLMFAAIASLIQKRTKEDDASAAFESACLLSLAFGFGAITVPYLGMFFILCLIVNSAGRDIGGLAIKTGWLVAVPLVPSMAVMIHRPMWQCALGMAALLAVVHVGRKYIQQLAEASSTFVERHRRAVELTMVIVPVAIVAALLPVKYELRSLAPLDGMTSFAGIFLAYNDFLPPYVSVLAIFGFLVALFRRNAGQVAPGIAAMIALPFVVLAPVLALAHRPDIPIPFHPQHLWDLAKDVPNWCWGVTVVTFCMIFLATCTEVLVKLATKASPPLARYRKAAFAAIMLALFGAVSAEIVQPINLLRYSQWNEPAYLTSAGGHREAPLALVAEGVMKHLAANVDTSSRRRSWYFLMDGSSMYKGKGMGQELYACGVMYSEEIGLPNIADPAWRQENPKGFLLASEAVVAKWHRDHPDVNMTELVRVKGGDSLFCFEQCAAGEAKYTVITEPAFPFPKQTLLGNVLSSPVLAYDDLASTKMRNKDGKKYLWGKESGTVWATLPETPEGKAELQLRIKFSGGPDSKVVVTSPAFTNPMELTPETRSARVELKKDYAGEAVALYGRQWIPFHFVYKGVVRQHESLGYMNSYCIDKFILFGRPHID